MGMFNCELLEQRGTVFPDYICKFSRAQIPKETVIHICQSDRHRECADYKRKNALFSW